MSTFQRLRITIYDVRKLHPGLYTFKMFTYVHVLAHAHARFHGHVFSRLTRSIPIRSLFVLYLFIMRAHETHS
jgi:hypothetical protein